MHRYSKQILEHHLDSFGHVNNATYLELFEEARWDLITNNGFGLQEIQKTKMGPVILEVNLKFMKELKNRESITIVTELIEQGKKIGKLRQQILLGDNSLSAEAIFTFALFDLKERKLLEPTPQWKKAIGIN